MIKCYEMYQNHYCIAFDFKNTAYKKSLATCLCMGQNCPKYRQCGRGRGGPSNLAKGSSFLTICPWQYVYQFTVISNKMELPEELSNKNFHFYCSKNWKFLFESSCCELVYEVPRTEENMNPFFKFEGPPLPRPHCLYLG